jgi:hypothetical protein
LKRLEALVSDTLKAVSDFVQINCVEQIKIALKNHLVESS